MTPKNIAADKIVQYVRAMQNSVGSNVESIILAADGQMEVPEFRVASNCRFIGRQVKDLLLKSGILVAFITHTNPVLWLPREYLCHAGGFADCCIESERTA